ncbi:hypothetical protein MASR1M12_03090 [Erysipelotrichia bacterium]
MPTMFLVLMILKKAEGVTETDLLWRSSCGLVQFCARNSSKVAADATEVGNVKRIPGMPGRVLIYSVSIPFWLTRLIRKTSDTLLKVRKFYAGTWHAVFPQFSESLADFAGR